MFANSKRQFQCGALTVDGQREDIAHRSLSNDVYKIAAACDGSSVDSCDDIIGLQTGSRCRAVFSNNFNSCALRQTVALGFSTDAGNGDTNIWLGDISVFDDALNDIPYLTDGNGKTDIVNGSLAAGTGGVFGVGYADDFPVEVE